MGNLKSVVKLSDRGQVKYLIWEYLTRFVVQQKQGLCLIAWSNQFLRFCVSTHLQKCSRCPGELLPEFQKELLEIVGDCHL